MAVVSQLDPVANCTVRPVYYAAAGGQCEPVSAVTAILDISNQQ